MANRSNSNINFSSFQLAESDEYISFFLLCIAYQRIDFLEAFDLFKPKKIKLTVEDMESLYGFSVRDAATRDLLPEDLEEKAIGISDEARDRLSLFFKITRPHNFEKPAFKWEESRKFVYEFCERIQKSDDEFLPQVA